MKTLIELYDERPIENVLASEVFCPERTVFLCPGEIAQNKPLQEKIRSYFAHRGLSLQVEFLESSLYRSDRILKQLRKIAASYPDCAVDITGGTDAALFACGQFCAESGIPAFTYGRKRNLFFNIHNAEFAHEYPCEIRHTVEDCFRMAGGNLRQGRVDNSILHKYLDKIDPFFRIFLRNRGDWTRTVNYITAASQTAYKQEISTEVRTKRTVKGDRGMLTAPMTCLRELESIGFLQDLRAEGENFSFRFADLQIRAWLRDIGSVLELYTYKVCLDSGLFQDLVTSAVVDWEGSGEQGAVTNEIDVMAMRGVLPVFLSCKTGEVATEALNELAVLRDRFGGKSAKAAILTARTCNTVTRHRASELGIDVIDLNDLKSGRTEALIRAMLQAENP